MTYFELETSWTFNGEHNILVAATRGKTEIILQLLEEDPSIVNITNYDGQGPLHCACLHGQYEAASLLIEKGAQVNARNIDSSTPLCDACAGSSPRCVQLLLDHGAEVNPQILTFTPSPLHEAVIRGSTDCIQLLIDAGANPDARDLNSGTPLHIACQRNDLNCAEILLRAGADCKATKILQTPLHCAARASDPSGNLVKLLIAYGAEVAAKNNDGEKPYNVAGHQSVKDILTYFEQNPLPLVFQCRITVRQCIGRSRLPFLSTLNIPEAVKSFLDFR